MAQTFKNEERKQLMKEVTKYALETKSSYADIANRFNISVATVHEYIKQSNLKDPKTGEYLKDYYRKKTDRYKNIFNIERTYIILNEVLEGYTQEEIAKAHQISASSVSRDINERLSKYCKSASDLGNKVLKLNRNNKITSVERQSLKNKMLNPLELKIMTSASAYMMGIKLEEITKYYHVEKLDLIGAFVEVLESLDWVLYLNVKEKLLKEHLITLSKKEEPTFEEEPIENFRRR